MISVKELLEDFLAMGFDDDIALELAKQEYARRKAVLVKSNREAKRKREEKQLQIPIEQTYC